MDFSFKNILSNVFGDKEKSLLEKSITQFKTSVDLSLEKISFLNDSKAELIKAFDASDKQISDSLEKASKDEDKDAITRRRARLELNYLKDLGDVSGEVKKAQTTFDMSHATLMTMLTPEHDQFALYKAMGSEEIISSNHFAHLNFDVDVSKMSFVNVCEMLSKAMDEGALDENNIYVAPSISDDEYKASVITLAMAKQSGQLSGDQLKKARSGTEGLTPETRYLVNDDGTAYEKTVWVRKTAKTPEKSKSLIAQHEYEKNMQVGDKIVADFKGWGSGTKMTGANVVIKEIHPDHIVAKFEEDFTAPNGFVYGKSATQSQGREVKLPRTNTKGWNPAERFKKWIDPEVLRRKAREAEKAKRDAQVAAIAANAQRAEKDKARARKTHSLASTGSATDQTVEITHENEIQNGDIVEFTKDNEIVKGTVRSVWRKEGGKGRLTVKLDDGTQVYKQIPTSGNRPPVMKVITGGSVNANPVEGEASISNPTRMDVEMLKKLGATGVRLFDRSASELKTMTESQLESDYTLKGKVEQFNAKFPNLDLGTMIADIKKEVKSAGVDRVSNIRIEDNGLGFDMAMTGSGGFILKRHFHTNRDGTKSVYHAHFEVGSDVPAGSGLGKKLFRVLNIQYRRAAIDKLSVSANISSGAYAWGRYGFTASKEKAEEKVAHFKRAIGEHKDVSLEDGTGRRIEHTFTSDDYEKVRDVVKNFYANNPASTRFPMDYICQVNGSTPAKVLLNHNGWKGELDLTDLEQRDRFESYIQY